MEVRVTAALARYHNSGLRWEATFRLVLYLDKAKILCNSSKRTAKVLTTNLLLLSPMSETRILTDKTARVRVRYYSVSKVTSQGMQR